MTKATGTDVSRTKSEALEAIVNKVREMSATGSQSQTGIIVDVDSYCCALT